MTEKTIFDTFASMLDIVTLGSDILRKQAAVIPEIDRKIVDLADAMVETMHEGNGIGLAGPQVGELKRLFVTHVQGDEARFFINPQIIQTSNEQGEYEEGCLSIPGIYADIKRPIQVRIQAWHKDGRPFTLDAEGLLARVIQHEFDHLNGVLFLDYLDDKKRGRLVSLYCRKTGKLLTKV